MAIGPRPVVENFSQPGHVHTARWGSKCMKNTYTLGPKEQKYILPQAIWSPRDKYSEHGRDWRAVAMVA